MSKNRHRREICLVVIIFFYLYIKKKKVVIIIVYGVVAQYERMGDSVYIVAIHLNTRLVR